ncbi:MAG: hypothetical protein ACK5UX_00330 [Burkholderiales bacterium]|jgi:hypothetical protein
MLNLNGSMLADIVLAFMVVEGVALWLWHRYSGRGLATREILVMLGGGLCLTLALRAALTSQTWIWVALPLLGALVVHVVDLRDRLRRRALL